MNTEYIILLFLVALLYSSVGHGGASGYLAVMALAGIEPLLIKTSALILNLVVATIAFFNFSSAGYFNRRLFIHVSLTSVPCAFLGAQMQVPSQLYKLLLALCLILAMIRLLLTLRQTEKQQTEAPTWILLCSGAFIGFLSGIVGIGGGILLSPLLLLTGWAGTKEASGISAAFIVVNSFAGLAGIVTSTVTINSSIFAWVIIAIVGGIIGSYIGSKKLNVIVSKAVLSSVLFVAIIKLLV